MRSRPTVAAVNTLPSIVTKRPACQEPMWNHKVLSPSKWTHEGGCRRFKKAHHNEPAEISNVNRAMRIPNWTTRSIAVLALLLACSFGYLRVDPLVESFQTSSDAGRYRRGKSKGIAAEAIRRAVRQQGYCHQRRRNQQSLLVAKRRLDTSAHCQWPDVEDKR